MNVYNTDNSEDHWNTLVQQASDHTFVTLERVYDLLSFVACLLFRFVLCFVWRFVPSDVIYP